MHSAPILLLIVGLPLLGSLVTAANRNRWSEGTLARTASAFVAGAFIATLIALWQLSGVGGDGLGFEIAQWGPWGNATITLGLLGDSISIWWSLVVTGVGFLIHIFSAGYMHGDPGFGRYYAKLNYFVFAMSLLVLSDNYLGLLLGWAHVGLASFMLIGFWNQKPEAGSAAMKAFVMNALGEVGLILAGVLMFMHFGSFRFESIFAQASSADPGIMTALGLLLLMSAVAKSAQLPLHTWLPDAMQGPTPVSALIHAATMVTAGVYLVTRSAPIFLASETAMLVVAYVGGLSALFGAIVALKQTDIKKILAFSTMSQVGYMMLAAGTGAYSAAMFHFMTHAFFKAALFLAAGVIIHHLGGEQDIRKMGGIGKKLPSVYWMSLFSVLALAGAPPLAGFFSKEEILHGVKHSGHMGLWVLGVVVAAMTAFYMFRFFAMIFTGPTYEEKMKRKPLEGHSIGPEMLVPVGILTVLSVAGGWISIPGLTAVPEKFLLPALQRFVEYEPIAAAWSLDGVLVVGVAVIGAAWAISLFGPNGRARKQAVASAETLPTDFVYTGFHLDAVYNRIAVQPVLAISRWIGNQMDPDGVDGIVLGLAGLVRITGRGLRVLHSGLLRNYALTLVIGVVGILAYMLLVV